jgi:hypothetical protein
VPGFAGASPDDPTDPTVFYTQPCEDDQAERVMEIAKATFEELRQRFDLTEAFMERIGVEIGDLAQGEHECSGGDCGGCVTCGFTCHSPDFERFRIVLHAPRLHDNEARCRAVIAHEFLHVISIDGCRSTDAGEQLEWIVHRTAEVLTSGAKPEPSE